ncbi:hypothetical protein DPMN_122036 [Dreissena polymorpha]|uniref:Uncharacterized protein n=1 Tax=Dreissena polymorpha TaxID=45954 RepID=A0A9D4GRR5_DREPO|nr:hypothetical protein DPMN_122036 [Dreissena polymorpha]
MWSGLYLGALKMSVHVSGSECEPVSLRYYGDVPGVGKPYKRKLELIHENGVFLFVSHRTS